MKTLQDIKNDAYQEEDPEVAIEKAIMNTCCLVREQIYKLIDDMSDGKSAQSLYINIGLNDAAQEVVELEKEAGFKTRSWRASK